MERHGEAMRFVANPLHEQQRGIVGGERDWLLAIANEQELFFLRDTDRDEIREAELFQGGVGGGQLSLAAVDHDEIRKRSAFLEQLPVPPMDDFVHRGEVILSSEGFR